MQIEIRDMEFLPIYAPTENWLSQTRKYFCVIKPFYLKFVYSVNYGLTKTATIQKTSYILQIRQSKH